MHETPQTEPGKKPAKDDFEVYHLLRLVAVTIRDQLRILDEIESADERSKTLNKETARERRKLLGLAIEAYRAQLGLPPGRRI